MTDETEPPEEPQPEEAPWEVSEYRFEPPLWFELLVAGGPAVYFPPLILIAVYFIWRWVSG
jgi:hypothetical protein